jgi:large subunit ribosomal protein L6
MSRIGKQPILIPDGVTAHIDQKAGGETTISITGDKGSLTTVSPRLINCSLSEHPNDVVLTVSTNPSLSHTKTVSCRREAYIAKQLHGSFRTSLQNMVTGVSKGFSKTLYLRGTGFKASSSTEPTNLGSKTEITLLVGYSHPVKITVPENLTVTLENPTTLLINGIEKEVVGQFAAKIRSVRPPEPYKGKGITYEGEFIKRKAVKANK